MNPFAIAHPSAGLQRLLLTLWVGAMWAIGYLAAPVLFGQLDSRMQAGAIAGILFTRVSWIGLVSGALILLLQLRSGRAGLDRIGVGCVLVMLVITAVGQFGIQPVMEGLKAQAGVGVEMSGALRERFALWHGVSSSLYLLASLFGALAIWRSVRARD